MGPLRIIVIANVCSPLYLMFSDCRYHFICYTKSSVGRPCICFAYIKLFLWDGGRFYKAFCARPPVGQNLSGMDSYRVCKKNRCNIFHCCPCISTVCLSKKSWPVLYSNLLCKMGQDFFDIQFIETYCVEWVKTSWTYCKMGSWLLG